VLLVNELGSPISFHFIFSEKLDIHSCLKLDFSSYFASGNLWLIYAFFVSDIASMLSTTLGEAVPAFT